MQTGVVTYSIKNTEDGYNKPKMHKCILFHYLALILFNSETLLIFFLGKPIVSELLTISENKRDKLSIILAGYEDDMNDKIFSFNEGIKSRFELIYFEDFNEKELKTIWETQIKGRGFSTEEEASIVVSKRLFKCAGRKGFVCLFVCFLCLYLFVFLVYLFRSVSKKWVRDMAVEILVTLRKSFTFLHFLEGKR